MRKLKNISALFLAALIMISSNCQAVYAAQSTSYVTGDDNYRQPVPECYVVSDVINNIGSYEECRREGHIYALSPCIP